MNHRSHAGELQTGTISEDAICCFERLRLSIAAVSMGVSAQNRCYLASVIYQRDVEAPAAAQD